MSNSASVSVDQRERGGSGALPSRAPREVVIAAPGEVVVREFQPVAPGPEEVRVETLLSGISHGTELNLLRGSAPGFLRNWDEDIRAFREAPPHKGYPVMPGYESVGRIVEMGGNAAGLGVGDLVWLDRPHRSEHVVSALQARRGLLPQGMAPEQGIFSALARVALGGVHDARIQLGDTVAIVGAGTIGLLAAQMARLSGAAKVFVLDTSPRRLALARDLGAEPIDAADGCGALRVKEESGGVDVAIDTSGEYSGLHAAIACCAPAGTAVAISSYQGAGEGLRLGEEFHRNRITLRCSMTVNGAAHRDHPRWDLYRLNRTARRLLHEEAVQVVPLLSHVIPVERAAEAYRLAQDSTQCTKIAFRYDAE